MVRILAVALCALIYCGNTMAGVPVVRGSETSMERGRALFERAQYPAAKAELRRALEEVGVDNKGDKEEIAFMMAICSARMSSPEAEDVLRSFISDYSFSPRLSEVHFALADILQAKGDTEGAYKHYLTVSPFDIPEAKQPEYNFKLGYSSFKNDKIDAAYDYFSRVGGGNQYSDAAKYYTAYIDYARGDYNAALKGFNSLADVEAYKPIVPFYILQIKFLQGDYGYVADRGPAILASAAGERRAEIARIVGESYFRLRNYTEALKYIEMYVSLGGRVSREENYLMGYCRYMMQDYAGAAEYLAKVTEGDDALFQNSCYHLGGAFLAMGDKQKAMQAFALASRSERDKGIREDAMFNYGKLQYELGGGVFNEAIGILNRFITEFPSSPRVQEAREYLLAAYFNSRNYDAAYEAIQKIDNPDNNVKAALQKISYFRALELFQAGENDKAIAMFDVSLKNPFTAKYTALSKYWKGEALFKKGDYDGAYRLFREYVSVAPVTEAERNFAMYNMGYCDFNLKRWAPAETQFNRFVAAYKPDDNYKADAFNRLGDLRFVDRKYWAAITEYDKAIRIGGPGTDYSKFQRAVMLGLVDRPERKIESLQEIISLGQGDYVDDAMYELGRTYIRRENFREGALVLRKLVEENPSSPFYLDAMSDLGLTYQNLGNDTEALKYYKKLVEKSPSSPQARNAMLGIRNIYVDRNDVDSYFAFAQNAGIETNVTVVERDSLSYAAAERVYLSGNPRRTITLMEGYLKRYPKGAYRANALYAMGESQLKTGDRPGALASFEAVSDMYLNPLTPQALQQAAKIYFEDRQYQPAASYYKRLSSTATNAALIGEGLEGWINSAVLAGDDKYIIESATEILASPFANKELTGKVRFARAGAFARTGESEAAQADYAVVADQPQTAEGAESRYRVIEYLYTTGKPSEAREKVFEFASTGTPHQYWTARAFLVLGDTYIDEGDMFQARATLQSIADGYTVKDDGIIDGVNERMEKIREKEKQAEAQKASAEGNPVAAGAK